MIARGCAVNGANTILIDVNEQALAETRSELEALRRSSSEPDSMKVLTSVDLHATTLVPYWDWLTCLPGSMETSPVKKGYKKLLSKSSLVQKHLMLSFIVRPFDT